MAWNPVKDIEEGIKDIGSALEGAGGALGITGLKGFGGPASSSFGAGFASVLGKKGFRQPFLKPTAPPRRQRRRSTDPFDFFGTLFTAPATAELNPMTLLNQTV